jgi:hypothetical protein
MSTPTIRGKFFALYDYQINQKIVEVYQYNPASSTYKWYPMATSQKRDSYAQINLVFIKMIKDLLQAIKI